MGLRWMGWFGAMALVGLGALGTAACGPRREGSTRSAAVPVASVTPLQAPSSSAPAWASSSAPAPSAWVLPEIHLPGLPSSPRAALVGRWLVAGIDGKPVATAPGMATDPLDPLTYAAGAQLTFTADTLTVSRVGVNLLQQRYQVVSEIPPVRVTIDFGRGPTSIDFNLDGSAVLTMPTTPPHVLALQRG